jgi:hypothetical protein
VIVEIAARNGSDASMLLMDIGTLIAHTQANACQCRVCQIFHVGQVLGETIPWKETDQPCTKRSNYKLGLLAILFTFTPGCILVSGSEVQWRQYGRSL